MLDFPENMFVFRGGATLSGTFTNTGFIHLTDSGANLDALILNNAGTIVHGSVVVTLTNNSRINNLADGIYEFTATGFGALNGGAGNLFHNEGLIRLNVPGFNGNGTRWGVCRCSTRRAASLRSWRESSNSTRVARSKARSSTCAPARPFRSPARR